MKIDLRPTDEIRPYPGNPRRNDAAVEAVARSLKEFGWRQPVVVDPEGTIVVGRTPWRAATKLGMERVPVRVAADLTEAQLRSYRVADNATADIATWDDDLLAVELAGLKEMDVDLAILGFDPDELARLDDACPRVTCEVDEPAYRSRMSISFTCAALAAASIQRDLDVLRTIATFADVATNFRGFAADRAEDAFWDGWYARGASAGAEEAAADESATDGDGNDAQAGDDGNAERSAEAQVATVRQRAEQPVAIMLGAVRRSVGRTKAVSLLSAWEGFGRFSRECCGVDPLVLTRAWWLLMEDPVPEVRNLYAKAAVDAEQAANWHASLAGPWAKHAGIC